MVSALLSFLYDAIRTAFIAAISGFFALIVGSGLFLGVWFDSHSYGTITIVCVIVWVLLTPLFGIIRAWREYAHNKSFWLNLIIDIAYPVLAGCITGLIVGFRTAGVRPAIIGFIAGGIIGFVSAIYELFSSDRWTISSSNTY